MPIRITCPGCQAVLTLADTLRGKKVRCKSCDKVIGIPAASKKKVLAAGEGVDDEDAIQEEPKLQVKAKTQESAADEDTDVDEDQPKKKKKKKKKGKQGSMALVIGAAAVVVVLLLVGGGIGAFFMLKSNNQQKNQLAQNDGKKKDGVDAGKGNPNANGNAKDGKVAVPPVQPPANNGIRFVPKIQDGNPATKKGGDNIVSNVRGAGYRTERRSELKQIGIAFNQYADEFKGASRNDKTWLDYIKTFGPIREAVAEGYYKMNYNARLEGSAVIAYERDVDKGAHLCVRGDGSVDYVPVAELKTILGRDP